MFLQKLIQIDWFLVFVAFIGACFLYILTKNNARNPFSVLRALNIVIDDATPPLLVISDIVVTSAFGAFGVYLLVAPQTPAQAMAAGLGFVGLISAFGKEKRVK